MDTPNKQCNYVTRNRQKLTANERNLQRLEQFHCFNALDNIRQDLPLTWKERKHQEAKDRFYRKLANYCFAVEMVIIVALLWLVVPNVIEGAF